MWRTVQFLLALALTVGGMLWLIVLVFIIPDSQPIPVFAALVATIFGAGWLYGDFIFPQLRKKDEG